MALLGWVWTALAGITLLVGLPGFTIGAIGVSAVFGVGSSVMRRLDGIAGGET